MSVPTSGRAPARSAKAGTKTIRETARDIPVYAEPDVLVVGGGAAGLSAACAAARAGADTLLIDAYGYLGGTLTLVTLAASAEPTRSSMTSGSVAPLAASTWKSRIA